MLGVMRTAAMVRMLVSFAKDQILQLLKLMPPTTGQMVTSDLSQIPMVLWEHTLEDSKYSTKISGVLSVMMLSELKMLWSLADNSVFHGKVPINMIPMEKDKSGWITWNVMVLRSLFGTVEAMPGEITIADMVRMLVSFAKVDGQ